MPRSKRTSKKSSRQPANLLTTAVCGIYYGDIPPRHRKKVNVTVQKPDETPNVPAEKPDEAPVVTDEKPAKP